MRQIIFFCVIFFCQLAFTQKSNDITVDGHIIEQTNGVRGEIVVEISPFIENKPFSYYLFANDFLGELVDSTITINNRIIFSVSDISKKYFVTVKNSDASFMAIEKIEF